MRHCDHLDVKTRPLPKLTRCQHQGHHCRQGHFKLARQLDSTLANSLLMVDWLTAIALAIILLTKPLLIGTEIWHLCS